MKKKPGNIISNNPVTFWSFIHPSKKNNSGESMITAIVGVLLGGAAGFLIGKMMSRFGTGCPLLCNPKVSTIYFAIMGLLFATGNY
jgi:hypothetical protein